MYAIAEFAIIRNMSMAKNSQDPESQESGLLAV